MAATTTATERSTITWIPSVTTPRRRRPVSASAVRVGGPVSPASRAHASARCCRPRAIAAMVSTTTAMVRPTTHRRAVIRARPRPAGAAAATQGCRAATGANRGPVSGRWAPNPRPAMASTMTAMERRTRASSKPARCNRGQRKTAESWRGCVLTAPGGLADRNVPDRPRSAMRSTTTATASSMRASMSMPIRRTAASVADAVARGSDAARGRVSRGPCAVFRPGIARSTPTVDPRLRIVSVGGVAGVDQRTTRAARRRRSAVPWPARRWPVSPPTRARAARPVALAATREQPMSASGGSAAAAWGRPAPETPPSASTDDVSPAPKTPNATVRSGAITVSRACVARAIPSPTQAARRASSAAASGVS